MADSFPKIACFLYHVNTKQFVGNQVPLISDSAPVAQRLRLLFERELIFQPSLVPFLTPSSFRLRLDYDGPLTPGPLYLVEDGAGQIQAMPLNVGGFSKWKWSDERFSTLQNVQTKHYLVVTPNNQLTMSQTNESSQVWRLQTVDPIVSRLDNPNPQTLNPLRTFHTGPWLWIALWVSFIVSLFIIRFNWRKTMTQ